MGHLMERRDWDQSNIALHEIEMFATLDVSCKLFTMSPNVSSNEHCKTFRGMTIILPHFTITLIHKNELGHNDDISVDSGYTVAVNF